MSPHDRYLNDPVFRRLVDVMLAAIEAADVTPTEVREAAMVAQVIFEARRPRFYPIADMDWFKGRNR